MGTARQLVPVLAALVVLAGCDRAPSPVAPSPRNPGSAAATDPGSGRIAFVSGRDGNKEIYLMNADGSGVTRLTNDPASDFYPAWSPDGSRIAFTSTRDGHNNIYVMNADGSGVTQLTTSTSPSFGNQAPAWCGSKIAYMSDASVSQFPDVYSMNDDGTGQTRLTLDNAAFDEFPSWSPDCGGIAFTKDPSGLDQVVVMNADGSGVTYLTSGSRNSHPAWSPDGTRIAFSSDRGSTGHSTDIYVMNADGTNQTRITVRSDFHLYDFPAWSSDGVQIAFQSNYGPNTGTYVMKADGSGMTQLADGIYVNRPAWFGPGAGSGNQPPVAAFTSSCSALTCTFTDGSSDPDGSVTAYSWTFGDGGTSSAQNPSTTYAAAGTYTVTLTVTDNQGATNSVSQTVTVSAATTDPGSGRIAFVSSRDGNNEIYVMNADGTGLTRLTNDPASEVYPAWSPDGSRIAFTSTRDWRSDIYVMNADGTGVTQLTTSTRGVGSQAPAWCGKRIAYMSDDYIEGFPDVYVMNDDGTGQTRLTLDNGAFDEFPSWSPDCAKIAYTTDPYGKDQVVVMNADGSGATQLTSSGEGYKNSHPAWSPDGTRIAFSSDRDTPRNGTEIFVMNADGTQPTRVTVNSAYHAYDFPAWSPDGTQIAFWAYSVPTPGIYVTNVDGGGVTLLSDNAVSHVAWSGQVASPLRPREPMRTKAPTAAKP